MMAENVQGIFIRWQSLIFPVTPFQLKIKPGVINLSSFANKKNEYSLLLLFPRKNTFQDAGK